MSQYKTSPPVGYYFKDLGEEHLPQLLEVSPFLDASSHARPDTILNYITSNTLSTV